MIIINKHHFGNCSMRCSTTYIHAGISHTAINTTVLNQTPSLMYSFMLNNRHDIVVQVCDAMWGAVDGFHLCIRIYQYD